MAFPGALRSIVEVHAVAYFGSKNSHFSQNINFLKSVYKSGNSPSPNPDSDSQHCL